jgi:hypothetical protein
MINGVSFFSHTTKFGNNLVNLQKNISKSVAIKTTSPMISVQGIRIGDIRLIRPLPDQKTLETRVLAPMVIDGGVEQYSPDAIIRLLMAHILANVQSEMFKAQMSDSYQSTRQGLSKIGKDISKIGQSISNKSLEIGQDISKTVTEIGNKLGEHLEAVLPKDKTEPEE